MPYIGKSPTPVPLSASDLNDDIISLAKMAAGTDGNLITYDTSGNPVAVATGDDGQILTSAGAGQPCAFEAAAGGGKVGQIVQTTKTDTTSISSQTFEDMTGMTVDITPTAVDSKVLITLSLCLGGESGSHVICRLLRGATVIYAGDAASNRSLGFGAWQSNGGRRYENMTKVYLDEPATTSATTYHIEWLCEYSGSGSHYLNRTQDDNDLAIYDGRVASSIQAWEILA